MAVSDPPSLRRALGSLRAGRGSGPQLCAGVGASFGWPVRSLYVNSIPTPQVAERAKQAAGEGRGDRPHIGPKGHAWRSGDCQDFGLRGLRPRPEEQYAKSTAPRAEQRRGPVGRLWARTEQSLGALGCGAGALKAGRAPRSTVHSQRCGGVGGDTLSTCGATPKHAKSLTESSPSRQQT